MNINRIIISGNLVANPILRETNSGTPVASATIANNEFFNDGEGERQQITTFVDVTVWGKSAENFASQGAGQPFDAPQSATPWRRSKGSLDHLEHDSRKPCPWRSTRPFAPATRRE